MESFVIRTIACGLIWLLIMEPINCRFIHKIEDYNMPMPDLVAECRKGCLMKVCAIIDKSFLRKLLIINLFLIPLQFVDGPLNKSIYDVCSLAPNCFMCWDYCSMLYKDRKKKSITSMMCTDDVCVSFHSRMFIKSIDNNMLHFN